MEIHYLAVTRGGTSEAIMQLLTVHAGTQKKASAPSVRADLPCHILRGAGKNLPSCWDYLDPVGVNSMGDLQDPIRGGT